MIGTRKRLTSRNLESFPHVQWMLRGVTTPPGEGKKKGGKRDCYWGEQGERGMESSQTDLQRHNRPAKSKGQSSQKSQDGFVYPNEAYSATR